MRLTHMRLNIRHAFTNIAGQNVITRLRQRDVIFNTYTNASPLGCHLGIGCRHINARLDGHHHTRLEHPPFVMNFIITHIMHIHTQPMSGSMHVKRLIGFSLN